MRPARSPADRRKHPLRYGRICAVGVDVNEKGMSGVGPSLPTSHKPSGVCGVCAAGTRTRRRGGNVQHSPFQRMDCKKEL